MHETEGGKCLEFSTVKEDWNVYRTETGVIVRLRLVVSEIIDTGKRNESGEPIFSIRFAPVITVKEG